MVGVAYHVLLLVLIVFVTASLGWDVEPEDYDLDTHYLRRNGVSLESTTQNLGNGTTLSINYPIATVHIYSGGTYRQFANTSLDYVFHINASSTVYIEGFRNSSVYFLTVRRNTQLRIAYFNTWIDRFNLTSNYRIKQYSDIDVNTTTNTVFINKIVSRSTTSSIITLPRNQKIYLTKMEPTYQQLSDFNFIIDEEKVHHVKKPPLSKAMTAVVIICCTFVFMVSYYAYNKRLLIYRKVKALVQYEDLLLYQIQMNVDEAEQEEIQMPVLSDEKIDKKVVKYLKKAAKVAETTQQADGNVVAVFADRNGEIVDVVKNQQAFVSYQMSKFGRNTINMQRGEEAVNDIKKMVEDNNTKAKEEFLQVGSMKSGRGRKNRAAMKMFNTAHTDLSAVAPGVQEGVLTDVAEEEEEEGFGAPEDSSPQMTRARGHAMVKLAASTAFESGKKETAAPVVNSSSSSPQGSPKVGFKTAATAVVAVTGAPTAAAPAVTTTTSIASSTNNGTYKGTYNYSMPATSTSSASTKEVKPSEMKSSKKRTSPTAASVSSTLASTAAAAATTPVSTGLYYYPPNSSFAAATPPVEQPTLDLSTSVGYSAAVPAATTVDAVTPFAATDYSSSLYGAAAPTSTSFDLNASTAMSGYTAGTPSAPFAPLMTTSFDMSGINTSDFSTYAAGGYDSQALTAAYVPMSMDYNTSQLTNSAEYPYGTTANLGATSTDYAGYTANNANTTSYYDQYGNTTAATTNGYDPMQGAPLSSYSYGDANAYQQSTVDYNNTGGQYDYNSYNASNNQYATADTQYQQYGGYNSSGY